MTYNPATFVFRLSLAITEKGGIPAAVAATGLRPSDIQEVIWQPEHTSLVRLAQLSIGLGVSTDWLLFGEGKP